MGSRESGDERVVREAAERVADQESVAWPERSAESPAAASLLEKLKLLERLGHAFRSAGGRAGRSEPAASATSAGPADLASRWGPLRVLDKLGEGSFGEVYRAHDPVLDRQVALKLGKRSRGPESERRYLEEARRLARVRHPNVVVVHGADVHEGRVGLWTDLVEGETLEEILERQGPLGAREAAVIGLDLCRALAAVHAQGLVHGDVKTSNVMRERGGRIVLMDFGTVKEVPRDGGEVLVTRGTPLALAPELLRGDPPTPAADLYSLGVLLYRLVTGRYPVEGNSLAEIVRNHEQGASGSLRDLRPDLPPAFVRIVERASALSPADRYPSAGAMERALADVAAGPPARARPWGRRALFAGAIAVVVAASYAVLRLAPRPAPGIAPTRRSVAVLGFKDLSGRADTAWLATALSEMLTSELAAGEKLRTIPGETVARAKAELSLGDADALAPDTLRRVRGNLGADLVALGSYVVLAGDPRALRIQVRLQDALAGDTVLAVSEAGTEAELFDLVARTGARLRARLEVRESPDAQRRRAALPAQPRAARAYAEGLARLRVFDAAGARPLLEEAVSAEPDFAPGHSALAQAWGGLGHDALARKHARRAFELSSGLPREERLFVEARFHEAARDWEKAIVLYRSLTALFPDDLEYGLRLAAAQTGAGRGKEALRTVEDLRRLPPPASEDARIDLEEAVAAAALSDDRRARAAAARAAEKGAASGARFLRAWARHREGIAWGNLREGEAALAAFDEAERLFAEVGDRLGVARTLSDKGNLLRERGELAAARVALEQAVVLNRELGHGSGTAAALNNLGLVAQQRGELEGARALFQESLAIERQIGDQRRIANKLNNLAMLARQRGELALAKATYEETLALHREVGDKRGAARSLNNIANVVIEQGDLAEGARLYEESLAIARELGDRRGIAILLHNLGRQRYRRGELRPARTAYEEALALRRGIGDRAAVARTLQHLGQLSAATGDLPVARTLLEESLATRRELGEKGGEGEARLALAALTLEEGTPASALELLRGVPEEFRAQKRPGDAAHAFALRARAAQATGDVAAARTAIVEASALSARSESTEARLAVTIAIEGVRAKDRREPCSPHTRRAHAALERAAREGATLGFLPQELDARLALAEVDMACGRVPAGRARLLALEKQARSLGFVLVADSAARLVASRKGAEP